MIKQLKKPGPMPSPVTPTRTSRPPLPKLRLRGDWSDTGPEARPERDPAAAPDGNQEPLFSSETYELPNKVQKKELNSKCGFGHIHSHRSESAPTLLLFLSLAFIAKILRDTCFSSCLLVVEDNLTEINNTSGDPFQKRRLFSVLRN